MRRAGVAAALFVAAALVGALFGAALGASEPEQRPSPALERGHPPAPGTETIDFVARDPHGGRPLAVLVFRSEEGRRCAAFGTRDGGRLVARRGESYVPVDLAQVAACAPQRLRRGDPPALQRSVARADPRAPGSRASTVVGGIAARGTRSVHVRTSLGARSVRPGRRGAFLVAFDRSIEGEATPVTFRYAGGRKRRMTIPAGLTQAQIERMLRERREPTHRGVHPPPSGG